jgi:putative membrane protein
MLLEIILALIAGIIIGTLTGLTPGIHINLVSVIMLGFSASLLAFLSPISLAIFLVAMAMTHTFIDFIPSIFLGAPDDENYLSILPGHELLIKGQGYNAIIYSAYGGLIGLAIILIFSPLFYFFLPAIYSQAEKITPLILIVTSVFLIYFEKTSKLWAIIIFLLSGILGLATLNLPIKETLLPLFTGLFGVSSLITSINKKQKIPPQKILKLKNIKIEKESILKSTLASVISSPICSFLPGMGSGQAAVIGSNVISNLNRKEFLILLGSINTIVTGLSFITLYLIGKARTGIAVAVGKVLELNFSDLFILTGVIVLSGVISFFITAFIARIFSKFISKVNYSILAIAILSLLILISFIFSGWLGLILLIVSSLLGLLCIYTGIRRTHLLGCLIIPSIFLLL